MALVINESIRNIQEDIVLFVDYIVLVDGIRGVNFNLELWRQNLESKEFKLTWIKTIVCTLLQD